MAITDINISEQLETSAPSIKYEGNEGPQSPQEERMVQLKQEYMQYVFEMKDIQEPVMSFEEWYQAVYQASKMGVDAGQQPQQPQQPQPQMRQPVAYGGIMDVGGRRRYGFGSRLRKLIPNEIAKVAEVAAPFVAPFNPAVAGLMSGIGGFDRHGSIGKGLKSGLMNYGLGNVARMAGGAGFQGGFTNPNAAANASFRNKYLSSPYVKDKDIFSKTKEKFFPGPKEVVDTTSVTEALPPQLGGPSTKEMAESFQEGTSGIMGFIDKNAKAILLGSMGLAAATATPQDMQEAVRVSRGTGLDIDAIRAEVQEAFVAGEEAWNELKNKYPYIGDFSTKKAEGGRIGLYAGGQSIPSDYTIEDAMMTTTQDKLGGITDVMKQADLYRQGSVGQFYAAQGGRIGADEGGLMDLGGMEKDYRNDGGFVPIGGEEKADDVPARLSKNEFVFTADAVRGAGGGDIDKGAEIMENIMKNLEQGGQISEETQGLSGAQEMFETSQRLGEVV